jgi:subtilisin family serine protease
MRKSIILANPAFRVGWIFLAGVWVGAVWADTSPYVGGEVIVKYKAKASSAEVERSLIGIAGIEVGKVEGISRISRVRILSGKSVEQTVAELSRNPSVEYAEPNYIYHVTTTSPDDPLYSAQWGLKNSGQAVSGSSTLGPSNPISGNNPGTSGKDMGLEAAWDYVTDCSSIIVAVVDTGVKYDHEDLASNMWDGSAQGIPHSGYNYVSNGNGNSDPMDDNGHGTHVAGTIGAAGNNGLGATGICWKVEIMAIKTMDSTGSGNTVDIANGITWAVNHGAKVINLSLGSTADSTTLNSAIQNAQANGAVVVMAAGNSGTNNDSASTPFYPCNTGGSNAVCVAALDQGYALAGFSDYGAGHVDVGAPGVNIVSTWPVTFLKTTDDFSTGWTFSTTTTGGWGTSNYVGLDILSDPGGWTPNGTNYYAHNTDDRAYKSFTAFGSSYQNIYVEYTAGLNVEDGADVVRTFASSSGGDPVTSGSQLDQLTGSTGTSGFIKSFSLPSACKSMSCSVGFELVSGSSGNNTGPFIWNFDLLQTNPGNGYNVIEGTSMATPHVAGLAAMLFAYNPSYTYADVVDAIKYGGVVAASLVTKTKTGRAVSAIGSLSYIRPPQGVTAVRQ